jgi:hypothetical protein
MNEEMDVTSVGAETTSESTENNEQVSSDSEVVNTQETGGKDYKAIAEQLSKDIKEKNRKIQELKSKQSEVRAVEPEMSDDETVRRFVQTEANATIALKLQTDPSFKDRVDIVQNYVREGYTIDMADKLAKADIMDRILSAGTSDVEINKPKQIQPTAIPEQREIKSTGNILDDIEKGLVDADPDLVATLRKYRSQG